MARANLEERLTGGDRFVYDYETSKQREKNTLARHFSIHRYFSHFSGGNEYRERGYDAGHRDQSNAPLTF